MKNNMDEPKATIRGKNVEIANPQVSLNKYILLDVLLCKGWKFLKKLWCCVGGGNKVIWLYQLSWKCKLATQIGTLNPIGINERFSFY